MRTPRIRSLLLATLLLVLGSVLSGCRPTLVYAGDPAQLVSLADPDAFERSISRVARDHGYRAEFEWFNDTPLEEIDPVAKLLELAPDLIVLSPYLSLLVNDVARAASTVPIVAFRSAAAAGEDAEITSVAFTEEAAMEEAGAWLADWLFRGTGREVVLLAPSNDDRGREALERAFAQAAGVAITTVEVASRPTRETVRAAVQSIPKEGETCVVLLLDGSVAGWALEFLQDESTLLVIRGSANRDGPLPVVATIRPDYAAALSQALGSPGTSVLADVQFDVLIEAAE